MSTSQELETLIREVAVETKHHNRWSFRRAVRREVIRKHGMRFYFSVSWRLLPVLVDLFWESPESKAMRGAA